MVSVAKYKLRKTGIFVAIETKNFRRRPAADLRNCFYYQANRQNFEIIGGGGWAPPPKFSHLDHPRVFGTPPKKHFGACGGLVFTLICTLIFPLFLPLFVPLFLPLFLPLFVPLFYLYFDLLRATQRKFTKKFFVTYLSKPIFSAGGQQPIREIVSITKQTGKI